MKKQALKRPETLETVDMIQLQNCFNQGPPVLEYGSGFAGLKPYTTENIGNHAMQYILGLNRSASLHALHGDMGWKSIYVCLKINMLRLWNMVNINNGTIPSMTFIGEYNIELNNWCLEVEQLGDINCNNIFSDI